MEARITCVYDEGALENTSFIGAKGTSFLIDIGGKRVLFDTGLRNKYLLHNLEGLDVSPDSIDAVVVSQSHPDNSRALDALLGARTSPIDVYCPSGLYSGKPGMFSGSVGISDENRDRAVFHDLEGWMDIVPGVTVTPQLVYDDGYSEVFLVVEGNHLTIVSGRGVKGPAEVIDMVRRRFNRQVRAFYGSILLEKRKKPVAESYAKTFEQEGVTDLYLNHCTGLSGMTNLRVHLGLKGVKDMYVGQSQDL